MSVLLTYIPFLISLIIGIEIFYLLFNKNRPPLILSLILSWGIGLGISTMINFSSFIIFNEFNRLFMIATHVVLIIALGFLCTLLFKKTKEPIVELKTLSTSDIIGALILLVFSIPLWFQIHFYAFGGWDAWATWNFKAKFLFLAKDSWQNMFDHHLWRSSPHYPLFLPLTNLWSWIFQQEPIYQGPCFTTYLFTMLIIGLLSFGLKQITKSSASVVAGVALLSMPFYSKLALSQYCDNVVAFYLLASVFCLWMCTHHQHNRYGILYGFFIGIMTFTKNEGMLSAMILLMLSVIYLLWIKPLQQPKKIFLSILGGLIIGLIPSIIFYTFYAPNNITFINGLTSTIKHVSWDRFNMIMAFYSLEVGSPIWAIFALFHPLYKSSEFMCKWGGIWVILGFAVMINFSQAFRRELIIIPVFLFLFMVVITAYYWINTYFPIDWWLQVSLNRILSGVLPLVIFWVFLSFWPTNKT